jgi:hypothetical protein
MSKNTGCLIKKELQWHSNCDCVASITNLFALKAYKLSVTQHIERFRSPVSKGTNRVGVSTLTLWQKQIQFPKYYVL